MYVGYETTHAQTHARSPAKFPGERRRAAPTTESRPKDDAPSVRRGSIGTRETPCRDDHPGVASPSNLGNTRTCPRPHAPPSRDTPRPRRRGTRWRPRGRRGYPSRGIANDTQGAETDDDGEGRVVVSVRPSPRPRSRHRRRSRPSRSSPSRSSRASTRPPREGLMRGPRGTEPHAARVHSPNTHVSTPREVPSRRVGHPTTLVALDARLRQPRARRRERRAAPPPRARRRARKAGGADRVCSPPDPSRAFSRASSSFFLRVGLFERLRSVRRRSPRARRRTPWCVRAAAPARRDAEQFDVQSTARDVAVEPLSRAHPRHEGGSVFAVEGVHATRAPPSSARPRASVAGRTRSGSRAGRGRGGGGDEGTEPRQRLRAKEGGSPRRRSPCRSLRRTRGPRRLRGVDPASHRRSARDETSAEIGIEEEASERHGRGGGETPHAVVEDARGRGGSRRAGEARAAPPSRATVHRCGETPSRASRGEAGGRDARRERHAVESPEGQRPGAIGTQRPEGDGASRCRHGRRRGGRRRPRDYDEAALVDDCRRRRFFVVSRQISRSRPNRAARARSLPPDGERHGRRREDRR